MTRTLCRPPVLLRPQSSNSSRSSCRRGVSVGEQGGPSRVTAKQISGPSQHHIQQAKRPRDAKGCLRRQELPGPRGVQAGAQEGCRGVSMTQLRPRAFLTGHLQHHEVHSFHKCS